MKANYKQYIENLNSGFIKSKTLKVLNYVKQNPQCTIYEMRMKMNISHQTLTSAISNLMDLGLIEINGQTKLGTPKKHYSTFIFQSDESKIIYNIHQREHEKIKLWISKGLEFDISDDLKCQLLYLKTRINQQLQSPQPTFTQQKLF